MRGRYYRSLSMYVYGHCHRRWLPTKHTFRRSSVLFAEEETREKLALVSSNNILRWNALWNEFMRRWSTKERRSSQNNCHQKKINFLQFAYWEAFTFFTNAFKNM